MITIRKLNLCRKNIVRPWMEAAGVKKKSLQLFQLKHQLLQTTIHSYGKLSVFVEPLKTQPRCASKYNWTDKY